MTHEDYAKLYSSADVAKRAHLTPAAIRVAKATGRIKPTAMTAGGVALYSEQAVDEFLRSRRTANRR